ncbi:serpin family A member 12 [Phyllostomus discolor]|uniref:Serpin A12 n=1 Tax=Phyllostomus discolor TaxID=89673 RepID=A0A6J2L0W6_9CHIR|nr:serpin A12 [Phyllostomus discolor]KAF6132815.1 serpin family A member 12 [Phyllostomus discolor]
MNPALGLGLLLAGLLTAEGLLKPRLSLKNQEAASQAQAQKGRAAAKQLSRPNMDFGFKLYKNLASASPSKNILFSPVSISMAFCMLCLGAQNTTLAEIKQGLYLRDVPEQELHEGFHYLIQSLNQGDQNLHVSLKTALFIDQRLRPEKRFLTSAKNLYSANSIPTNFQNKDNARKKINDYISQNTQGKINTLIKNIDPGTVMLLVNYILFRARWKHEFDPKLTKDEDFVVNENKPVKVPMMFHGGTYEVARDDQLSCTVLAMPYHSNITALLVLPGEGRMRQVEEALGMDTLDRWKNLMMRRVVDVSVPRFSIMGTYDLKKILSYVGITKIFEENSELTKIVPNHSLKVGEAVHKAKLKMDEKGTEGAAGSGMETLPMERPLVFKLNRPFLVIIVENLMSTMLFLGKITNPTGT